MLVGLEGDVVKTLTSIKKGIELLGERRATLVAESAEGVDREDESDGQSWEDEAALSPTTR